MTRQERLEFCKKCNNRKFNPSKGIICGLTNDIALFDDKCGDFVIDEKIEALENYKKDNPTNKKVKKEKKKREKRERIPEQVTKKDIGVILYMSLFTVFIVRLISFAGLFSTNQSVTFLISIVLIFSFGIALWLREKPVRSFRVFSDIKFRLLLSLKIALLNLIYLVVLHQEFTRFAKYALVMFLVSILISFLSIIAIIPINRIAQKRAIKNG